MVTQVEIKKDRRSIRQDMVNLWINRFGVYFIIIIFMILGVFISEDFLTAKNLINIIDAVTLLSIVAIGVSFVTYSGHFADMSVPLTMAVVSYIVIDSIKYGIVPACILAIIAGMVIGVINAFVVGKIRANPIIWTLAVAFVVDGFLRWFYNGKQDYPDFTAGGVTPAVKAFYALSRENAFWKISYMTLIMFILVVIAQFLLTRTKYGQQLKLVGSALNVAKLTGVKVSWVVGRAFILSSFTASVAGLFLASQVKVAAYYNGAGYDFNAVTAIVLGGMTLGGGRGSIIGVLGGAIALGLMQNLMTLIGIGTFAQSIVKGAIFILIVGINTNSLRKLGRDDA